MNHENHKKIDSAEQIYTCPMHPEIRRDKPGMCPECGMNLVPEKKKKAAMDHGGHKKPDKAMAGKHAGHSTAMFFRKFWVSLLLTVPVVLYADVTLKIFKWSPPDFPSSAYMPLAFGTVVFFYGGWVFLIGAWREIKGRLPGMMTLIGIAISAAYFWSLYAVLAGAEALFWELTTLITIMLLGHWLEIRVVSNDLHENDSKSFLGDRIQCRCVALGGWRPSLQRDNPPAGTGGRIHVS